MIHHHGRAWVMLLVLAGMTACSDVETTPLSPRHASVRATAEVGAKERYLAQYRSGPPSLMIGFAVKTIGPEGGRISLEGFEVVVPAGAVDQPTRFTIRLPVDNPNAAEYVSAEFGPHGQTFAVPVRLRLPLNGTTSDATAAKARVLWWSGTEWTPLSTTATQDGRIEAPTTHFSEYGTENTDPTRGFILAGG